MTEQNRKWSESPIHDQVKRAGLDNAGEAHTFNTMTTPRTDRAATTIKDYSGYDEVVPADVCRDIERDLAELKKDKERLDWLLKNCLIKELDLEWVHDSRETIDEAMKVKF